MIETLTVLSMVACKAEIEERGAEIEEGGLQFKPLRDKFSHRNMKL